MDADCEDEDALKRNVERILSSQICATSRKLYRRLQKNFILWNMKFKREVVSEKLAHQLEHVDEQHARKLIDDFVGDIPDSSNPPLKMNMINASLMEEFVLSVTNLKSDLKSSTLNSYRSAFINMFRDYRITMADATKQEISSFFKGLKRRDANNASMGITKITTGKDPLQFSLYRKISEIMLRSDKKEHIFGRCVLVISWNLMCRVSNSINICFSHLEWIEDALGIYFAHMKNDQMGERPRDARRIYANSDKPEICPILSLAIYLLCFPIDKSSNYLFPGENQYIR